MISYSRGPDGWYVNRENTNDYEDYSSYGPFRWKWQARWFKWRYL